MGGSDWLVGSVQTMIRNSEYFVVEIKGRQQWIDEIWFIHTVDVLVNDNFARGREAYFGLGYLGIEVFVNTLKLEQKDISTIAYMQLNTR